MHTHINSSCKLRLLYWLMLLTTVWSCASQQSIELRDIKNVSVSWEGGGQLILTTDVTLYNDTGRQLIIKAFEFDIYVNERQLGTVKEVQAMTIANKSPFTVAMKIKLVQAKENLLAMMADLSQKDQQSIRLKGYVVYKGALGSIKMPINYIKMLNIKL